MTQKWEYEADFNPKQAQGASVARHCKWVDYRGTPIPPGQMQPEDPALPSIHFRDPATFVAGELHRHVEPWDHICAQEGEKGRQVMHWIRHGVDLHDFIQPFKGDFAGKNYDHDFPPPRAFRNSNSCQGFEKFVAQTLEERITNGSVSLLGRVGDVEHPIVISPLTVEPTKPRLCVNLMYLNNFMRDTPFKLDTLVDIPKVVEPGTYLTSLDDKSSYDHVMLTQASRQLTGFTFQGWVMTLNTVPFGWKNSAYVYQLINVMAMSSLRKSAMVAFVYIDDRLIERYRAAQQQDPVQQAKTALEKTCSLLVKLGFYLSLKKSVFTPTCRIMFLGLLTDTLTCSFRVPQEKRDKLRELRNTILQGSTTTIQTLQRFQGKCVSLMLAVPAAKLYIREMSAAIAAAAKESLEVAITQPLRDELQHWSFLDGWEGHVPWKSEYHQRITVSTDSSSFKWGGILHKEDGEDVVSDYWPEEERAHPIMVLEARALLNVLTCFESHTLNTRVDANVDNTVLIAAWQNEGCRCAELNKVLKELFHFTLKNAVTLKLTYIASADNPADHPSRDIRKSDCRLSTEARNTVDSAFGGSSGHTFDLMALDSNAFVSRQGNPLPHYTQHPSPASAGVNVFSHRLVPQENYYAFPPFSLIPPLVKFIQSQGAQATLVIPGHSPPTAWHPQVSHLCEDAVIIGRPGDKATLEYPTKKGYLRDRVGLGSTMWAVRINPAAPTAPRTYGALLFRATPHLPVGAPTHLVITGDSIVRFLLNSGLGAHPLAHVFAISGGRVDEVATAAHRLSTQHRPRVLIMHVGINHLSRPRNNEYEAICDLMRAYDRMEGRLTSLTDHTSTPRIAISAVLRTGNSLINARVDIANERLQEICKTHQWTYLPHTWLEPGKHLKDGLHLNVKGQESFRQALETTLTTLLL